jgi:tripartite-type tricarboxylate transporter receptor subunit TctC
MPLPVIERKLANMVEVARAVWKSNEVYSCLTRQPEEDVMARRQTPSRLVAWLSFLGCLLLLVLVPTDTQAQGGAAGPVRLVVGSPAGGAIDVYARAILEPLSKALGQAIIVETRPGANGNLAAQMVVDGPADGTLIWIGTQSMTEINPIVYSGLRWTMSDFVPIIKGVEIPLVLTAHPSVPAQSLDRLVAWLKSSPGKYSYASYAPGSASHFLGFQLSQRFGLDLAHVPYRGSAPQTSDLLAGHALLGFAQIPNVAPHVREQKLVGVATTGAARSRQLPQVATFTELGHPDFTASVWFGLFIKRGASDGQLNRLLSAAKAVHGDPETRARLEAQGFEVSGVTGPEFPAAIESQAKRWSEIVKATGFKAE